MVATSSLAAHCCAERGHAGPCDPSLGGEHRIARGRGGLELTSVASTETSPGSTRVCSEKSARRSVALGCSPSFKRSATPRMHSVKCSATRSPRAIGDPVPPRAVGGRRERAIGCGGLALAQQPRRALERRDRGLGA
ncbi:MAG: hypothetical protein IPK74_11985 [Deltaproteobacteria bacterium]|nr:hypothetical protein [Deltaproteobacteria bacterium]